MLIKLNVLRLLSKEMKFLLYLYYMYYTVYIYIFFIFNNNYNLNYVCVCVCVCVCVRACIMYANLLNAEVGVTSLWASLSSRYSRWCSWRKIQALMRETEGMAPIQDRR